MKFSIITQPGIEETVSKEIKEFFNLDAESKDSYLNIELPIDKINMENLFKFLVLAQSPRKIVAQIAEFDFIDIEDLQNKISKNLDDAEYFTKDSKTFFARCIHVNNKDICAPELEPEIGSLILDKYSKLKVSLKDADIKFLLFVNKNKAVLGIDLTRNDLSKRQYKLINSGKSLRADIAYHMIRAIDFKEGEILVDPNSKTAEISIEAALHVSKMHNYYETIFQTYELKIFDKIDQDEILKKIKTDAKTKLKSLKKNIFAYSDLIKDVTAGKSNAKVAGVLDIIEFSKVSLDWLDTKFDKEIVDKISSFLPSESKHIRSKDVKKIYTEFLYQVDYILKKSGLCGILLQKTELFLEMAKQKQFKAIKQYNIIVGELELIYVIIQKN